MSEMSVSSRPRHPPSVIRPRSMSGPTLLRYCRTLQDEIKHRSQRIKLMDQKIRDHWTVTERDQFQRLVQTMSEIQFRSSQLAMEKERIILEPTNLLDGIAVQLLRDQDYREKMGQIQELKAGRNKISRILDKFQKPPDCNDVGLDDDLDELVENFSKIYQINIVTNHHEVTS